MINSQPFTPKETEKILPSYFYHEEASSPSQNSPSLTPSAETNAKNMPISPLGIKKPEKQKQSKQQVSQPQRFSEKLGNQNINLTMKTTADVPLLKLLSKATAAHLTYPKISVDFHERGTVSIGFIIYPDGHVDHINIIKSSGSEILDKAALAAIYAISPVKNVSPYLPESKYLVVGIIFG